jgi:hypothetical protein
VIDQFGLEHEPVSSLMSAGEHLRQKASSLLHLRNPQLIRRFAALLAPG